MISSLIHGGKLKLSITALSDIAFLGTGRWVMIISFPCMPLHSFHLFVPYYPETTCAGGTK
jgi:hypothetical protein